MFDRALANKYQKIGLYLGEDFVETLKALDESPSSEPLRIILNDPRFEALTVQNIKSSSWSWSPKEEMLRSNDYWSAFLGGFLEPWDAENSPAWEGSMAYRFRYLPNNLCRVVACRGDYFLVRITPVDEVEFYSIVDFIDIFYHASPQLIDVVMASSFEEWNLYHRRIVVGGCPGEGYCKIQGPG